MGLEGNLGFETVKQWFLRGRGISPLWKIEINAISWSEVKSPDSKIKFDALQQYHYKIFSIITIKD
ncbi:hypothetical protein Glove_300g115 [Diversispora epigaea]|uniref:Uncharacterized protein n=1 Tax=Diversispora epigaea TaxID=1348612 RepID=A0A397HWK9_9GLOM|nr:hypothetical protein Glove_300g115 [Diversispora epigaea]